MAARIDAWLKSLQVDRVSDDEEDSKYFERKFYHKMNNDILMYGFLRNSGIKNIPKDVVNLMFIFWFIQEFDPKCKAKWLVLSDENKIVKHTGGGGPGSIFLPQIICSGYYIFKFKVISQSNRAAIGLWRYSIDRNHPTDTFFTNGGAPHSYGYYITDGKKTPWIKYGKIVNAGDTVLMIVDFESLKLSFCVNDEELGISHNIKQDTYKVAVDMSGCGKIRMMDVWQR